MNAYEAGCAVLFRTTFNWQVEIRLSAEAELEDLWSAVAFYRVDGYVNFYPLEIVNSTLSGLICEPCTRRRAATVEK